MDGRGELVSTDRNGALPDTWSIGDDKIGVVGADVDSDNGFILLGVVKPFLVIAKKVIEGHRGHLDDIDVAVGGGERLQGVSYEIPFDGEDADLNFGTIGILEGLPVPLDFVDVKGYLLDGLKADEFRDPFALDGGKFDESCKTALAGYANDDGRASEITFCQKSI